MARRPGPTDTETAPPEPSSVASPELSVPLGRYVYRRVIGTGGMGVVVAAHDPDLGREVAIKLVSTEREQGHARLMREAQAMARLSHPNVVTVHEIIRDGDRAAIVMELVDGENLATWREVRERTWQEIVAVYSAAARGLAAAHRAGLVHRDFKPSNALIATDGTVRVTDFGLVRASGDAADSGNRAPERDALDIQLTDANQRVGTPAYMAPEQHRGDPVDARTDQWALACSMFEALYGERPFPAPSRDEIEAAVLSGDMKAEPADSRVPRPVRRAIRRALSRDPADRFASIDEFLAALSPPAAPVRRRWIAGVALLVAIGVAGVLVLGRGGEAPVATAPGTAPLLLVVPLDPGSGGGWLGTAVAELLTTELGAGDRLRVVPAEAVNAIARARGLRPDQAEADIGVLGGALAADYTLSGRLESAGGGRVRIALRLRDGKHGTTVAEVAREGTEAELFAIVAGLGGDVRAALKVAPLSRVEQVSAARAQPRSVEGARAYSEGLSALRQYQAQRARVLFERAVAVEPDNAKYQAALSEAWKALQSPKRALAAAERAFALSGGLPHTERMFIEARLHQLARRFDRAGELYSALATFFPENVEYGLALAELQNDAGRPREMLGTVERLRSGASPDRLDARINLFEGMAAMSLGDLPRAERAAQAAVDKARAADAPELAVRAELVLCGALSAHDFDRGLVACRSVVEQSTALGDRGTAARASISIAWLLERRNQLEEGLVAAEQARRLYEESGNEGGVAHALYQAALILKTKGDPQKARELLVEALGRAEAAGDETGAARYQTGMASVELALGHLDSARKAYLAAIELNRKLGAERGLAVAMQNLAWVEADLGDAISARRHAEEAMAIQERLGLEVDLAYSLDCVALMALNQDELAVADTLLARGIVLREKAKLSLTATLQNQAEVRLAQGRFDEARALIARSVASTKGGVVEGFVREVEARVLLAAGDLDGADRALRRARELTGDYFPATLDGDGARILSARGRGREAMVLAERARAEAARQGTVPRRLDAEAALGEAELIAGIATGRERLERSAREAASRGYFLSSRLYLEIAARKARRPASP